MVGVGIFQYISDDAQLRSLVFWMMGSFGRATWVTVIPASILMLVSMWVLLSQSQNIDRLQLGEAEAMHMGVNVKRTKRILILTTACAVGAGVSLAGIIGFVGLVVPHLARMLMGARHQVLLPASALMGAALMILADLASRVAIVPAELPVSLVTSGLGAPFFSMVNRKDTAAMSISVDQVSVSKLGKAILTNVSLHILSGRVTALIGPNGAGKSTLLKVVSGDEKPSGGSISIDSTFLDNLSATELAKIRSVMTQSSQIVFDFLTEEIVALGLAFGRALNSEHNRLLIDEVVETCGIRPLLGRVFRTLSGGEQQRVLFARAVAQISEPMREKVNRYIFLDEPTSSLDVQHELSLLTFSRMGSEI